MRGPHRDASPTSPERGRLRGAMPQGRDPLRPGPHPRERRTGDGAAGRGEEERRPLREPRRPLSAGRRARPQSPCPRGADRSGACDGWASRACCSRPWTAPWIGPPDRRPRPRSQGFSLRRQPRRGGGGGCRALDEFRPPHRGGPGRGDERLRGSAEYLGHLPSDHPCAGSPIGSASVSTPRIGELGAHLDAVYFRSEGDPDLRALSPAQHDRQRMAFVTWRTSRALWSGHLLPAPSRSARSCSAPTR